MKKLCAFCASLVLLYSTGCTYESPESTSEPPLAAEESSNGDSRGELVVVDDSNFERVVLQSDKPVLVDFWATWCGPCKMIAPAVEEIASEYQGRAVIAKLDVDVAGQTAQNYNITSIPALIVFQGGQEVSRVVGVVEKSELTSRLDQALAK